MHGVFGRSVFVECVIKLFNMPVQHVLSCGLRKLHQLQLRAVLQPRRRAVPGLLWYDSKHLWPAFMPQLRDWTLCFRD
jgi:hypothetical protein